MQNTTQYTPYVPTSHPYNTRFSSKKEAARDREFRTQNPRPFLRSERLPDVKLLAHTFEEEFQTDYNAHKERESSEIEARELDSFTLDLSLFDDTHLDLSVFSTYVPKYQ